MRIDVRRQRFIVSLSSRDLFRLMAGGTHTSLDVSIDGQPALDHALTIRVQSDKEYYDAPPEPLPPGVDALYTWLFDQVSLHEELPNLWLESPYLRFGSDGQLVEFSDHRTQYVNMNRLPDAVIFDLDGLEVQVVALVDGEQARIVCWAGDSSGRSRTELRDIKIRGDEARRFLSYRREADET